MRRFIQSGAIIAVSLLGFFAFSHDASATAVRGHAWSDSAGWISMNCDQTPVGGTDTCSSESYGVDLDLTTGYMSGLGWSDNVGWIRFDPHAPTPSVTLPNVAVSGSTRVANPPLNDSLVHDVQGWARFCSDFSNPLMSNDCNFAGTTTVQNGSWNGWVQMKGVTQNNVPFGVKYSADNGQFTGYAWGGTTGPNGSEVVGWISFEYVKADKVQSYIPVIDLEADPVAVSVGGQVSVSYQWTNFNPSYNFVQCNAFTDTSTTGVNGWSLNTFPSPAVLPSTGNVYSQSNVSTLASPGTITYYLECLMNIGVPPNVSTVRAADPSNPGVECNPFSPAGTCPRTTVTVSGPPPYTPVIKLTSISPVSPVPPPGYATTSITYQLMNPSSHPAHQIGDCYAVIDNHDIVPNWEYDTFFGFPFNIPPIPAIPKPDGTPRTQPNVGVMASPTTYYLFCMTVGGAGATPVAAADWLTPSVPCDFMNDLSTCPKTTVTIGTPAATLSLKVRESNIGNPPYQAGSIQISPGGLVDLQWSSTEAFDDCRSTTLTSAQPPLWATGALQSSLTAANSPAYTASKTGIDAPNEPTRYKINCRRVSTGLRLDSNIVEVRHINPAGSVTLEGKLTGQPDTAYTTNTIQAGASDTVHLRWTSPGDTFTHCNAISSPNATGWTPTPNKPGLSGPTFSRNQSGIPVPANSVDYKITCTNSAGTATSNTVTVIRSAPPISEVVLMIKRDSDPTSVYGDVNNPNQSVLVPTNETVSLHWEANVPIVPGSCVATSVPSISNWNGSKSDPAALPGAQDTGVGLDTTPNAQTVYTITCTLVGGGTASDDAFAIALPPPAGPFVSISGPSCVKTDTTVFDLRWFADNLDQGSCSFVNNNNASFWQGSTNINANSVSATKTGTIGGPALSTTFTLECTALNGTIYSHNHQVDVDPNCTQAPRRNWFFRFFER